MGNSIFIDPTMKAFYSNKKTTASATASTGSSYLDILKSLQKQQETTETAETKTIDEMTMEEYKEYITATLNSLPMHSSRSDSTSAVIISNAGWEKMKEDPAYEQWVIGTISSDFASQDPWEAVGSSSYNIYRFGSTMEQYSHENWGKDYPGDVKSYLTTELFNTSKSNSSGNFLFRLARKKMQKENQAAIQQLATEIAQLQNLKLMGLDRSDSGIFSNSLASSGNGFQLASAQNALYLMNALNSSLI